jgi:hypothetical protein
MLGSLGGCFDDEDIYVREGVGCVIGGGAR